MAGTSITSNQWEQQVEVKGSGDSPLRAGRTQAHDHPAAAAPRRSPWSLQDLPQPWLHCTANQGDRKSGRTADGRPQSRRWWKRVRPGLQVQTSAIPRRPGPGPETAGTVPDPWCPQLLLRPGQGPSCSMDGSGARAMRSPLGVIPAAIAQDHIVLGGRYASPQVLQDWRG